MRCLNSFFKTLRLKKLTLSHHQSELIIATNLHVSHANQEASLLAYDPIRTSSKIFCRALKRSDLIDFNNRKFVNQHQVSHSVFHSIETLRWSPVAFICSQSWSLTGRVTNKNQCEGRHVPIFQAGSRCCYSHFWFSNFTKALGVISLMAPTNPARTRWMQNKMNVALISLVASHYPLGMPVSPLHLDEEVQWTPECGRDLHTPKQTDIMLLRKYLNRKT